MSHGSSVFIAIDLKSFYASVECVDRGLDPLTTNLVVADVSRTEKTICLAVSPSLKSYGVGGRARLFEVVAACSEINAQRRYNAPGHKFVGKSYDDIELKSNPNLELDYIAAKPQMARYVEVSTQIYSIYLNYVAPEDIHVYSIDEVFIDVTSYLELYNLTAVELANRMVKDVLNQTGITATAGIGTNLYLCKIAMDIVAKHMPANEDGVRIAYLDEKSYRELLWNHVPLTDFWRVGHGIENRLRRNGMLTMGDVARMSLVNQSLLYKLFGINAELLIDHAWGYETCTMKDIKSYMPQSSSLSTGQVLPEPYSWEKGKLIIKEMADLLALDLVDKGLMTDQIVIAVGYDVASSGNFEGPIAIDHYGRKVPPPAHGSINLGRMTSSSRLIIDAVTQIYDRVVDKNLYIRRLNVIANHTTDEELCVEDDGMGIQLDMFTDYEEVERIRLKEKQELNKEKNIQKAVLEIKKKFGKNAMLKGMNLEEGAKTIERNGQIGGHRA